MSAQIIVFIDDVSLIAFDVSSGQIDAISFDGRKKLPCTGAATAERFSSYINDYYNYEDISEFSEEVLLVDCGADADTVDAIRNISNKSSARINVVKQDIVAAKAFRTLEVENEQKVKEYGMNFYGKHYFLNNGKLMKKDFLLTGYCLDVEEAIKYVKDGI